MMILKRSRLLFPMILAGLLLLQSCDLFGGDNDDDQTDIDVLVAYTASAADSAGGNIEQAVGRALRESNAAYANSAIDVRLVLVHLLEVDYEETDRLQDLERLMRTDDGYLDDVHAARDEHDADIVILVTSDRALTINGAVMAEEHMAFALVHVGTLGAPDYALAHEIGHLQGARHSPESDPREEPFPYGHGFRNDSIKTIMSTGRLEVVPYFSGPNVVYEGSVLGDSTQRDVARVLRETAVYISNFRGPTTETSFIPPTTWPTIEIDE